MRINRKTLLAGAGAAGLLGAGLYIAVPAAANPSPSPSASPKEHRGGPGQHQGGPGAHKGGPWKHKGNRQWAAGARGVHGEATVRRKDGFHVLTWQRGQVTARSGATFTVRSADGTSWQWTTDAKTRVRKQGEKSDVSALASGAQVVVSGDRSGTTRTAALVRLPKN